MEIFKSGVDLLQLGVTAMGGGAVLMGISGRGSGRAGGGTCVLRDGKGA